MPPNAKAAACPRNAAERIHNAPGDRSETKRERLDFTGRRRKIDPRAPNAATYDQSIQEDLPCQRRTEAGRRDRATFSGRSNIIAVLPTVPPSFAVCNKGQVSGARKGARSRPHAERDRLFSTHRSGTAVYPLPGSDHPKPEGSDYPTRSIRPPVKPSKGQVVFALGSETEALPPRAGLSSHGRFDGSRLYGER